MRVRYGASAADAEAPCSRLVASISVISSILAAVAIGNRPTDLTFVRHAETLANATGKYNARTLDTFSPKGSKQVERLTKELLASRPFGRILVSPSPRAMRTVLPYLKATGQKATIWPLLYECCTQKRPSDAHREPYKWGGKISIPADCAGYFLMTPGQDRYPAPASYNEGLMQVEDSLSQFRSRFEGGRILIVGHSGHGGQFLHALTGRWIRVENAKPMAFALR